MKLLQSGLMLEWHIIQNRNIGELFKKVLLLKGGASKILIPRTGKVTTTDFHLPDLGRLKAAALAFSLSFGILNYIRRPCQKFIFGECSLWINPFNYNDFGCLTLSSFLRDSLSVPSSHILWFRSISPTILSFLSIKTDSMFLSSLGTS